jgi:spermidine/putrescine transport system permease protein
MIASLPRPPWLRAATALYLGAFLLFLFVPLVVVAVFAFNNAPYPAPPWHGFTLDWFLGNEAAGRVGLFRDSELLGSIWTSVVVASWVTALSVTVGTANAFLMERYRFPGKQLLSVLMLVPLVIPGVILGISILAFCSRLAELADSLWGLDLDFLRPGLVLVVLGQFSFVATIATLMVSARLKRFDRTLEEAALNLGASQAAVLRTITFPYLRPALIGTAAISFLMSFENFNTTLMLVGADPPLTVLMYGRMREGASPVLNAVSLFLMLASALLAFSLMRGGRRGAERTVNAAADAASGRPEEMKRSPEAGWRQAQQRQAQ